MPDHPDDERPPLGFLLVRIAEAVDRAFVAALADLGLTPRHLRLLVLVDRTPRLSQRELARQLGVDAGNLVALLDAVEAEGLLRRSRDQNDRRQRLVTLTADGRRRLAAAVRATEHVEAQLFANLSASRLRHYYETSLAVYGQLRQAGSAG